MKYKAFVFFILISWFISSCSKSYLDRPSQNQPTINNYYQNQEQVEGATALLYNQVWYNWLDKAFHSIGEVYSGNMVTSAGDPNYGNNTYVYFTVQPTDEQLLYAWQAFYKVAGNASVLINTFQQIRNNNNADFIDAGIAEAQFIRGVAYFFIARTFGNAPIVTDPVALSNSGNLNVPRYLQKDVLRFALNDFAAAENALPETPYQAGRVTKYSAAGMAAKVYLYMDNYDSAAIKANEVIQSGKYSLHPDYAGMFTKTEANNNSESLFALQWVAGAYSYSNNIQAYEAPACLLKPDFNTGYSSVIPTLDLLNAYEAGDKRKGWSVMRQGYNNTDWTNANFPAGFSYDTAASGVADDATHVTTGTRSNALKYINGPKNNSEYAALQPTAFGDALNVYLLRYADVLLIYAEGILGNSSATNDMAALNAFNLVHTRAGLAPVQILTKDMLLHERRVEFAFEGDYWYDVQRQGFAKAQEIINAQERGTLNGDGSINHVHASFTNESQLYLPIPSDEVVADPELARPAVPYY